MRKKWTAGRKNWACWSEKNNFGQRWCPNSIQHKWCSRKNKKANDLLKEATVMHNLLAKSLWHYKIRNKSGLSYINSDNDSDIVEQYLKFI